MIRATEGEVGGLHVPSGAVVVLPGGFIAAVPAGGEPVVELGEPGRHRGAVSFRPGGGACEQGGAVDQVD